MLRAPTAEFGRRSCDLQEIRADMAKHLNSEQFRPREATSSDRREPIVATAKAAGAVHHLPAA
jgi:hypothetical protein